MDGIQERILEGGTTNSERDRNRRCARRAKMSDEEKFGQWIKKHQSATGLAQIPADIMSLPCGCKRTPGDNSDFRHWRHTKDVKWVHLKCVAIHPKFDDRYKEQNQAVSHFAGPTAELLDRVRQCLDGKKLKPGKFPGTFCLPIPADGVFTKAGAELTLTGVVKPEAKSAEVVFYSRQAMLMAGEKPQAELTIVAVHGFLHSRGC